VEEPVLRLLALRLLALLEALEGRGHAAQAPLTLDEAGHSEWRGGALPAELRRARAHPEWSTLSGLRLDRQSREAAVAALAAALSQRPGTAT
jgi:hypothetical protein